MDVWWAPARELLGAWRPARWSLAFPRRHYGGRATIALTGSARILDKRKHVPHDESAFGPSRNAACFPSCQAASATWMPEPVLDGFRIRPRGDGGASNRMPTDMGTTPFGRPASG